VLSVAKFDRYDIINNPGDSKPAFTIWFSGCSMGCNECHSPSLQDHALGRRYTAMTVLMAVDTSRNLTGIDTVVLLGGEPLEQDIDDLEYLCIKLYKHGYKVWLYTGHEFDDIPDSIKLHISVAKCGPYIHELATGGFPASSNQYVMTRLNNNNIWERMKINNED